MTKLSCDQTTVCIIIPEPVYDKRGLWNDVIFVKKEQYDVTAVYFSICTKSKSLEQWKIFVIEE